VSGTGAAWPRPAGGRTSPRGAESGQGRLAVAVFAALVLATIGGLFAAQSLKHAPSAVQGFLLAPSFRPASAPEAISFRTSRRDAVTVVIVGSAGETVATLVRDLPWQAYLRLCLEWNGRRGDGGVLRRHGAPVLRPLGRCQEAPALVPPAGSPAPAGEYRVRVSLAREGATVLSPASFSLLRGPAGAS
jgi:hypothetical protein